MVDRKRLLEICCWVAAFIFSFVYMFYIAPLIALFGGLVGLALLFLSISIFGFLIGLALIYSTDMPIIPENNPEEEEEVVDEDEA